MNHEKNSNPEWTDAAIEVELAAISPLTIQAFNKDTFTVSSFKKLCRNPKMTLKVNYMNFPQEKLIGSNEFDLASLGGCTEKPVEVELKNKTDGGEDVGRDQKATLTRRPRM